MSRKGDEHDQEVKTCHNQNHSPPRGLLIWGCPREAEERIGNLLDRLWLAHRWWGGGGQREEIFYHPATSSWGPIITQSRRDCLTTCPWHWTRFIKCLEIPGEKAAQDKHPDCYFWILSQPDPTEVKKVYSQGLGQTHVSERWSVRSWGSVILISSLSSKGQFQAHAVGELSWKGPPLGGDRIKTDPEPDLWMRLCCWAQCRDRTDL